MVVAFPGPTYLLLRWCRGLWKFGVVLGWFLRRLGVVLGISMDWSFSSDLFAENSMYSILDTAFLI